jgi:hypothetical protein
MPEYEPTLSINMALSRFPFHRLCCFLLLLSIGRLEGWDGVEESGTMFLILILLQEAEQKWLDGFA